MSSNSGEVGWELDGRLPVLSGGRRPEVSDEEVQRAQQLMESAGLVLFRDFDLSVEDFRALTRRLGNTFSVEKFAPHARVRGGPPIGLHTEQAFRPAIPSAVWFYSAKPAEQGGATVVCDGTEVLPLLTPGARRFLEETDVLYWHRISGKPQPLPYQRVVEDPPSLGRNFREHELIEHEDHYETTALCRPLIYSRFGRRPGFGNHILNSLKHDGQDEPPAINGFHQARLPTKEPLPRELLEELRDVTTQLSMSFRLGEKDAVWVDNTRFMHGREAFEGTRQILALKAFYADQWMPGHDPADYPSRTAGPSAPAR